VEVQRAWDTAALSEEQFTNHFVLAIKNNLPFQTMLISDIIPGHPNSLLVSILTPTPFFVTKHVFCSQWIKV
jgi:hypothetical protein